MKGPFLKLPKQMVNFFTHGGPYRVILNDRLKHKNNKQTKLPKIIV